MFAHTQDLLNKSTTKKKIGIGSSQRETKTKLNWSIIQITSLAKSIYDFK